MRTPTLKISLFFLSICFLYQLHELVFLINLKILLGLLSMQVLVFCWRSYGNFFYVARFKSWGVGKTQFTFDIKYLARLYILIWQNKRLAATLVNYFSCYPFQHASLTNCHLQHQALFHREGSSIFLKCFCSITKTPSHLKPLPHSIFLRKPFHENNKSLLYYTISSDQINVHGFTQ